VLQSRLVQRRLHEENVMDSRAVQIDDVQALQMCEGVTYYAD
jgi:hypothetical protein